MPAANSHASNSAPCGHVWFWRQESLRHGLMAWHRSLTQHMHAFWLRAFDSRAQPRTTQTERVQWQRVPLCQRLPRTLVLPAHQPACTGGTGQCVLIHPIAAPVAVHSCRVTQARTPDTTWHAAALQPSQHTTRHCMFHRAFSRCSSQAVHQMSVQCARSDRLHPPRPIVYLWSSNSPATAVAGRVGGSSPAVHAAPAACENAAAE